MSSPHRYFLIVFLVLWVPTGAAGQSAPAVAGHACLGATRPAQCLEQTPLDDPGLEDAWLALGLRLIEAGDIAAADQALSRVNEDRPGVRGLQLWANQYGSPALLRPTQSIRNRSRAHRVLRRDSLDAGASLLIGTQDALEVLRRSHRTAVSGTDPGLDMTSTLGEPNANIGPGLRFSDRYRGEVANLSVRSESAGSPLVTRTLRRLRTAAESPVLGRFALHQLAVVHLGSLDYEALAADAARFRAAQPHRPEGFLFGVLAAQLEGREEAAATLAEMGLSLLPAGRRADLLDPGRIRSTADRTPVEPQAWWSAQDPIVLTTRNERLTEHVARWVYADALYGNPYTGTPGAETDPGRVVLRYGIPAAQVQFTGGERPGDALMGVDRFSVFSYNGFEFRFMDLARSGTWTFYSPSATAFQGGRANSQVLASDYVLKARERFRDMPYLMEATWEARTMEGAVFRGEGGYDVIAIGVVPDGLEDADRGAMVLDENNRIVSLGDDRVPGWVVGEPFVKTMHVPVTQSPVLTARLETVAPATLAGPSRTVVFTSPSRQTPSGPGLAVSSVLMSDLVEEDESGAVEQGQVRRMGLRITPSTDHSFALNAPIYAYFEVYGLSRGVGGVTDYEVTATLEQADGRSFLGRILRPGDDSVGAGFRSSGSAVDIGEYLLIDSQSREPGDYLLTLAITDRVSQTTVETTTPLQFR